MKAIAISVLVFILSFVFLTKPIVSAFGGSMKVYAVIIVHLVIAGLVYAVLA